MKYLLALALILLPSVAHAEQVACRGFKAPYSQPIPGGYVIDKYNTVVSTHSLVTTDATPLVSAFHYQSLCQGLTYQQGVNGFGFPNRVPVILLPVEGSSLDVTMKCVASSTSPSSQWSVTKHAVFKVSAPTAGQGGPAYPDWHFITAKQETVAFTSSSDMTAAYVGIEPDPVSPILNVAMHGIAGKAITWGCSYGYDFVMPPQTPVDYPSGQPTSGTNFCYVIDNQGNCSPP
jgi:hypothetical protein